MQFLRLPSEGAKSLIIFGRRKNREGRKRFSDKLCAGMLLQKLARPSLHLHNDTFMSLLKQNNTARRRVQNTPARFKSGSIALNPEFWDRASKAENSPRAEQLYTKDMESFSKNFLATVTPDVYDASDPVAFLLRISFTYPLLQTAHTHAGKKCGDPAASYQVKAAHVH